ncbi:hypothetical protein BsWGS_11233 [Bradybaena similaris]
MAYYIGFTLIIAVKMFAAANSFQGSSVPVLLWTPEKSSQLPEVMGVNPIQSDDFLQDYLTPFMKNATENVVAFLQDQLNMDHFTKYADVYSLDSDGGAFKNVKGLMEDHFSLELPQVANPSEAIDKLKESFPGDVHTVRSAKELEGLALDKDKRFLIMVQLNPVSGQKDHENTILQNDAIIGDISKHLRKHHISYRALFTGQSSSDGQTENVESRLNRHLLATTNHVNGTFFNVSDGSIYIFIRRLSLNLVKDSNKIRFNLTVTDDTLKNSSHTGKNSTHSNETAEIRFDFLDVPGNDTLYNISIVTEARRFTDRWTMRVALYVNGGQNTDSSVNLENATFSSGENDFTIPIIYSWHCTEMQLFLDTTYNKNNSHFKGTNLIFDGYQLQPFNIQKNRFLDAQDCVPYFTTAIWMFLFSALFLVSILIFGVLMVLSLSTMDKYDDPKGKTISVAQGTD